jgi:hypothetical protein
MGKLIYEKCIVRLNAPDKQLAEIVKTRVFFLGA